MRAGARVRGRVYRRQFDYTEACARFSSGETISDIARDYGVSWTAVAKVVRPQGAPPHVIAGCLADGCERLAQARGYCAMHYQRLRQYGSLERTTDMVYDPVQRFWRFVEKTDTCWNWTGATYHNGYGLLHFKRKRNVRAHRFAYELLVGPIPEGLQIDHLCSVRRCVNPAHLEPVTARENVRRAHARRRSNPDRRPGDLTNGAEPSPLDAKP